MNIDIDINKLDKLINDQYLNLAATGELMQLSKLFEPKFLADLLNTLKEGLSNSNSYNQKLEISVCWIDKRPLADFTKQKVIDHNGNTITKKVEVGDAAFIFSNELCCLQNGEEITKNENSVSLIFQAKRSSKKSIPNVPIGTGKSNNVSTSKELALLAKWPVFDLFKASRSKSPLYSNLSISQSGVSALSYGWFGACPPGKTTDWKSRWMCAPANNGQKCSFSLGEVFAALINKNELSHVRVGKEFNLETDWGKNTKKRTLDSWDILNNEILYQCRNSLLPKSIFSSESPRLVQVHEYLYLDENLGFALVNPKVTIDSSDKSNTKITNYLTETDLDNSQTLQLMKNECFPVLLIALKRVEG